MNSITTLIDADTIIFYIAYHNQETTDVEVVIKNVDDYITLILDNTNCTHYLGFIGGTKCFRYEVAKHLPYKGNRGVKPEWFTKWDPVIRHRMISHWGFIVCDNIEAEDGVSICNEHYKNETNTIIAHVDKDSNDIEGNHYNYKSHTFYHVDYLGELTLNNKKKLIGTGRKWFWSQMIIGDKSTDNIEGLKGKGDVFAYNLLNSKTSEYGLFRATYIAYINTYTGLNRREYARVLFRETLQLVGMLTQPAYGFEIPKLISRVKELSEEELINTFS
jgi:hypothetical protein